ncbi:MAG: alpha/beta fold hydrolase [Kofleriaceae bacterium]
MTIEKVPVSYRAGDVVYRGTLVRQTDTAPVAAVVLLPDWRGQSPLAFDHARFLVERGCVVMIADLYGDGFSPTDPKQVTELVKRLVEHREVGVAAVRACFDALEVGTVARFVLGYSAGGMIALDYGRSGAAIAGIVVASALLKTAAGPTKIAAPVLVLQGTQDQVSPMSVIADVIAEMDAAGNDARFELYSQTHHAFDNPEAGTDPTARLCYSPAAAARSRQAIADFIETHRGR